MSTDVIGETYDAARRGLLLSRALLLDGQMADVFVRDGLVVEIAPPGHLDPPGATVLDLTEYLLLPAPAEPHTHLDMAFVAETIPTGPGDVEGGIDAWLAHQSSFSASNFVDRATRAALQALANGATAIRSHVGIHEPIGLRGVEALLEVKEALKDLIDIQLVALTARLTGTAGAHVRAMMRTAIEMGVDVVGGVPHIDPDPRAYHEFTLQLAAEFGVPIDLHTDETIDREVLWLPEFAALVKAMDFRHGATASHCVSLGMQPGDVARAVAAEVASANVAVVCNPQTNLYLQGRDVRVATPRGLTALHALREAGVTIAAGSDNLRDTFNVVGRLDPLETASLVVTAGHLTIHEAYQTVTSGARAVMGLPEVRLEPGYPAELLAVRAGSLAEAISGGASRIVIHRGRVVSRTEVRQDYPQLRRR